MGTWCQVVNLSHSSLLHPCVFKLPTNFLLQKKAHSEGSKSQFIPAGSELTQEWLLTETLKPWPVPTVHKHPGTHQGRLQREAGRILTAFIVFFHCNAHVAVSLAELAAGAAGAPVQGGANKQRLTFFTVVTLGEWDGSEKRKPK